MPACLECGEENPRRSRYCWACGAPLQRSAGGRAERRIVTVLFCDLVGFTSRAERLDPEEVAQVLAPYYARARAELERFGGSVEKFIGDAVMALFGAPVVHEDDPERAVRAAFAIRQAIDDLNAADPDLDLQVRIGINTGEALVDVGARRNAGEAMAAGDVVNTAARLQQTAPVAGIVVGEATYRATSAVVEFRSVEPVAAKGKHRPVEAWEAVALRPRRAVDLARRGYAPLVGRRQELEHLLEHVSRARAAAHAPELVTLVGAPGIGKSRLVWELYHALDVGPGRFVWRQGRCLPYGAGVTFWAFAEMVKAEAGILETDGAEQAGEKLHAAVAAAVPDPSAAAWVEARLRPLVGLGGGEQLARDRRGEAFAAWRRFVEAIASRGLLVLVFEDLHWADEGLLDFVEHLAQWAKEIPLALVCTARPELLERRPAWAEVLRLEPLSSEDTAALLRSLLEEATLPDELQDALLARAAGNPLYAEEYVRMLADRGLLREGRIAEGELPLPESVQAIIAARLDELSPEVKAVLQDAAVVGKGFWTGALAEMGGLTGDETGRRLVELQRKEFVRPQPRTSVAGESQYAFWHLLVRDVAYAQIPRARRAEKHRLAAEWIESLAADRTEDLAEMLAYHYTSAIEYARLSKQDTAALEQRARVVLRDAGDRALALYAFAAAVRFYRGALELWPADDPERHHLLFRYGKALFWAESGGDEVLAEARESLLAAGDREAAAEVDVMLSRLCSSRGERDRAVELAEQAVARLDAAAPSRAKAEALSNLAAFLALGERGGEAIAVSSEALSLAEQLRLDETRAHALTFKGLARVTLGDRDGIADLERGVDISEHLSSPEVVRGYANLASTWANVGDLRRAWGFYAEARNAAERFGDTRGLRWLASERLFECYWRGQWDEALALAESVVSEIERGVQHYMGHDAWHVRGWIGLARGDLAGALEAIAHALEFGRSANDPQALFPSLALHSRALLAAGFQDEAGDAAEELLALWASSGPLFVYFWLADLAFVLTDLGGGEKLLHVAHSAKAETRWLEAARLLAGGRAREAADVYGAIGAEPEEALARQRAASALAAAGRRRQADTQLRRAAGFYRQVEAEAYARECEALLAASN